MLISLAPARRRELCWASALSMNSLTVPKKVRELETEDDIGPGDTGRTARVKRVHVGEVHAAALVDNGRVQRLGQLHKRLHSCRTPGNQVGDDDRVLRSGKKARHHAHRNRLAHRRRGEREFWNAKRGAVLDPHFLQVYVEHDQDRLERRRHGDPVGAHDRFGKVLKRAGLVVPFEDVTDHCGGVLHRMYRGHARPALIGVAAVAGHHDHGSAVAPGVVDAHCGVLQTDGAVAQRDRRLACDLEIAMRHCGGGFLMHRRDQLRLLVIAIGDDGVVQAAAARRGIGEHIVDIQCLDAIEHEVGARTPLCQIGVAARGRWHRLGRDFSLSEHGRGTARRRHARGFLGAREDRGLAGLTCDGRSPGDGNARKKFPPVDFVR